MRAARRDSYRAIAGCLVALAYLFPVTAAVADEPVTEPVTGMIFQPIPAGCFDMGDLEVGVTADVCVGEFWLGRHEVTNAQFQLFRPEHRSGRWEGQSLDDPAQPAVGVSWHDAVAFAGWLSAQAGKRFRLPTEAEWELAARAGTTTMRFWGNGAEDARRYANVRAPAQPLLADGHAATAPVGSYAPSPFQLFDMLGNVSEWLADGYRPGPDRYGGKLQDPLVPADGPLRVRRGGSFDDPLRLVAASPRDFYLADLGVPQTGFRLVMEP